ncbi:hypothetical protein K9L67_02655 [Candidatus Woesearchaeota archaeon]|nr:hypothetical protein [Candidatus Woesearchaeota archaeon]MCF7901104.1 hypothetical protein [Candidatus Woesearchaeota archaeon]MCF8013437.1 hypothetical protein [Candidatus Woesearchaeota archaeon]
MSKKNKNKPKKVSAKKERYSKFHKEKPGTLDIKFPDLDDEQQKQKKEDEEKMEKFLRFNRNKPASEIVERRMKDKRSKIKG